MAFFDAALPKKTAAFFSHRRTVFFGIRASDALPRRFVVRGSCGGAVVIFKKFSERFSRIFLFGAIAYATGELVPTTGRPETPARRRKCRRSRPAKRLRVSDSRGRVIFNSERGERSVLFRSTGGAFWSEIIKGASWIVRPGGPPLSSFVANARWSDSRNGKYSEGKKRGFSGLDFEA